MEFGAISACLHLLRVPILNEIGTLLMEIIVYDIIDPREED